MSHYWFHNPSGSAAGLFEEKFQAPPPDKAGRPSKDARRASGKPMSSQLFAGGVYESTRLWTNYF